MKEVQDRADQIVHTTKLNPVNAIELLDSMAKAKALYACKIVAVPKSFLHKLDTIILNAVRQIISIPRKHGSRNIMHAPTFLRGFRIKSMEVIYNEAVILAYFKLLNSEDSRLKEIIRIQVTQFLKDTNSNFLELGEVPPNNHPKSFSSLGLIFGMKKLTDQTKSVKPNGE